MVLKNQSMLINELNDVANSYRSLFTGRRNSFVKDSMIKIGGRSYYLNMAFNHHKYGNFISIEGRYQDNLFKTLEMQIQPSKNVLKYHSLCYTASGPSRSYLFMRTDSHIYTYLIWTPEMLKNYIDQLKLLLVKLV